MAEQDWAEEHAHEIVGEWLRADFRGDASLAGRAMLESLAASALRDAYARGHADGMADAAKVAEHSDNDGRGLTIGRGIARDIRRLARLPGGEEGEDGGSDER